MHIKTSYELPKLSYSMEDLEPIISKELFTFHYLDHHQKYVDKLNQSIDMYHLLEKKGDAAKFLNLQSTIKYYARGHINHCLFWQNLTPLSSKNNGPTRFE